MTVLKCIARFLLILAAFILAGTPSHGREQRINPAPGSPKKDVVILDHADSLVGLELDGEKARQLLGHVQFTHGRTVVTCDRAIQYLQTNRVALEGEVTVRDDSMTLYTYRGMYYADTKTAEGFDLVRLVDGKSTLRARYGKYFTAEHKAYFKNNVSLADTASDLYSNELTYYRDSGRTIADGNVKIFNRENSVTLFGGHFENERNRKYSLMVDNPRAMQIDTTESHRFDTLFVVSERMESYQDTIRPRLIATGSVAIKRTDFFSEAGQGVFYSKADSIELKKTPFVWFAQTRKETTQVSGDSIFVKLNHRKLETMFVRGSAFAASQADSLLRNRYSQMSGKEMIVRFKDSVISRIDVDKTATMMYFVFDGTEPNGLNKTTGDHGTITFIHKKIDAVTMKGGVEGQYYPEKMVRGKETDFNLEGFNWRSPRLRQFAFLH